MASKVCVCVWLGGWVDRGGAYSIATSSYVLLVNFVKVKTSKTSMCVSLNGIYIQVWQHCDPAWLSPHISADLHSEWTSVFFPERKRQNESLWCRFSSVNWLSGAGTLKCVVKCDNLFFHNRWERWADNRISSGHDLTGNHQWCLGQFERKWLTGRDRRIYAEKNYV